MPYTINRYQLVTDPDGKFPFVLADNTIDNLKTTLKLLGKGVSNYGEAIAEDLVWLLENFAGPTPPTNPVRGQVWYDTSATVLALKVYNGTSWDKIQISKSTSAPVGPQEGELWYNSTDKIVYYWNGITWVPVGTNFDNGITYETNNGNDILIIRVGGVIVGIWSNTNFTPNPAIPGFPNILRGLNLTNTLVPAEAVFNGEAVSANYADLAERYASDSILEEGDIVSIGGSKEITKTKEQYDTSVFGIFSPNPQFKMNSDAGNDITHPYIALTGRVKCKIIGKIKKGDRVTTSNLEGVGIKANILDSNITPWCVFARALEDKEYEEVGLVEVVIGMK